MVWPTLGSRTAKKTKQSRLVRPNTSALSADSNRYAAAHESGLQTASVLARLTGVRDTHTFTQRIVTLDYCALYKY